MKPWHLSAFSKFERMMRQQHLPHALLISGAAGIGKLELALYFVRTMLCENENACGSCENCVALLKDAPGETLTEPAEIRRSHYPHLIYCRTEKTKKGAVAKNILINQVRRFCEALTQTADALQIGILFYADQMNVAAANSLLKTLEEPRDNTVIILLTHQARNLPATILSRCQKIHIPPAFDEKTKMWLEQNLSAEHRGDFDIDRLLSMASGVPSKVLDEMQSAALLKRHDLRNDLLALALAPTKILTIDEKSDDVVLTLQTLRALVIEIIQYQVRGRESATTEINQIVKGANAAFLWRLFDDINQALRLCDKPINAALLLDNVLIVWAHILHLKYYPQFLAKTAG